MWFNTNGTAALCVNLDPDALLFLSDSCFYSQCICFSSYRDMESSRAPLSEAVFEEIMNRNRAISCSAISRAVSDASAGANTHTQHKCLVCQVVIKCSVFAADYGSAIETLVTSISLIKQSKVSADDRCKVLISSLQDCLHGILWLCSEVKILWNYMVFLCLL